MVVLFTAIAVFFHWGWKWATVFYVAVAAAVAYGYSRFIAGTEIEEYFKTRFIQLTFEKEHDSGRGYLHDEAFRIMGEHRIFGGGLHSFVVLSTPRSSRPLEHPHNIFYTVGSEAGVIGIGLLVIALVVLAIACRHLFKFLQAGLTAAVAFSVLVAQVFSGYYYDSRSLWLFGFAAAFAMLSLRRKDKASAEPELEPQPGPAAEPAPVMVTDTAEPVVPEPEPAVAVVKQSASDNKNDHKKLRVAAASFAAAGAVGAIGWLVRNRSNAEVDARAEKLLREMFNEK